MPAEVPASTPPFRKCAKGWATRALMGHPDCAVANRGPMPRSLRSAPRSRRQIGWEEGTGASGVYFGDNDGRARTGARRLAEGGRNSMSSDGNGHQTNGNGHTHNTDWTVPMPRTDWIVKRKEVAAKTGDWNMSQMHFARQGLVTEEMAFVAHKEKISPELVRSEIAKGTMILPANINHPELEPMAIGVESLCKINANIGNSALSSNVDEELRKLHTAVHFGADTVMDLSTGGDIPMIREAIIRHSPVPIGTVPLYEALSRVKRVEDLNIDLYLEVIEEQAQQGVD